MRERRERAFVACEYQGKIKILEKRLLLQIMMSLGKSEAVIRIDFVLHAT